MKEKIIEILKSSLRAFAYIDPVTGESRSAQESAIPEDQFPKIAAELEPLINQEVEKRIKERMPDINIEEAEKMAKATDYACFAVESPGNPINFADAASFFFEGWYACRSRLTCSEKPNNSQKTEGGEG